MRPAWRARAFRTLGAMALVVLFGGGLTGCHELYCAFVEGLTGEPVDCSHDDFPDIGDIPIPSLPPPPPLPTTSTTEPPPPPTTTTTAVPPPPTTTIVVPTTTTMVPPTTIPGPSSAAGAGSWQSALQEAMARAEQARQAAESGGSSGQG